MNEIEPSDANYYKVDFSSQGIRVAETALQIMPSDTNNPIHLDYIKKFLENFSSEILEETRYSDNDSEIDYRLKHRFYRKFASFLLHREPTPILECLKPFIEAFTISQEMANFLSDVVSEEDSLGKYDSFWVIWECFYPVIKTAAENDHHKHLDKIIRNYMLAWPYWKDTAKE